jgi:hypothetical protein
MCRVSRGHLPFLCSLFFYVGVVLAGDYLTAHGGLGPYSLNCSAGKLPPGYYGPWKFWSRADFKDLTDLCDYMGNGGQNMGGACHPTNLFFPSRQIMIQFDNRVAQRFQLWTARLESYCRSNCHCGDEDGPPTAQDGSKISDEELWESLRKKVNEYDAVLSTLPVPPPPEPPQAIDFPYYSDWGYHCQGDCDSFRCQQGRTRHRPPPPLTRPGRHCICTLKPKGSRMWAQGSCAAQASRGMPFGGRRGKRSVHVKDDIQACACNATYVSSACCGAEEGLVWEGSEAWLGEVVPEEHALLA